MASRPLVLPNPFSGDQNWTEWIGHFEDVAAVNEWRDDDAKLQWLKVRLTGKAQTAFQRFPEDTRKSYVEAKKAMKARFEHSLDRSVIKLSSNFVVVQRMSHGWILPIILSFWLTVRTQI